MVGKTSKIIPITLEQEELINEVNEDGIKITETVGVAKISENITDGEYILISRKNTEDTERLFALAELIEKNEFTDMYTQISASKEFYESSIKQLEDLDIEKWNEIIESKIEQPKDAQTGDQYILYLKSGNSVDIHFLTSYREFEEEYIKEQITTILPYTYDNNTILIVLGIVIIAIIIVSIRIVILNKKEMKK